MASLFARFGNLAAASLGSEAAGANFQGAEDEETQDGGLQSCWETADRDWTKLRPDMLEHWN